MPAPIPEHVATYAELEPLLNNGQVQVTGIDAPDAGKPYTVAPKKLLTANVNATAANATTVIPAIMGLALRVYGWSVSNAHTADVEARLEFDDGTVIDEAYLLFFGGQRSMWLYPLSVLSAPNALCRVNLSVAGDVHVTVYFTYEDRPSAT